MAGDEADKYAENQPDQQGEQAEGEQAREQGEGGDAADGDVEARIREAVEQALAEQRDTVLRAQAEVQNMRRRCEQDVEKAHKYALEKFCSELVNVVDNLERALQSVPEGEGNEHVKAMQEGVELTLKGFLESLGKFNVEQIDPQGEPFDPQIHEAMTMQESGDVEPNTVLAVLQKGYTLNGRVIRPARVMVSKAPAEPQA